MSAMENGGSASAAAEECKTKTVNPRTSLCATHYAVAEHNGMVWVWGGDVLEADPRLLLTQREERPCTWTRRSTTTSTGPTSSRTTSTRRVRLHDGASFIFLFFFFFEKDTRFTAQRTTHFVEYSGCLRCFAPWMLLLLRLQAHTHIYAHCLEYKQTHFFLFLSLSLALSHSVSFSRRTGAFHRSNPLFQPGQRGQVRAAKFRDEIGVATPARPSRAPQDRPLRRAEHRPPLRRVGVQRGVPHRADRAPLSGRCASTSPRAPSSSRSPRTNCSCGASPT